MNPSVTRAGKNWVVLLDLFACVAGFALAALCDRWLIGPMAWSRPGSWMLPWALCATVGWLVIVFPERQWHEGVRLWVDGLLAVMGTNLLVQCGLTYLFRIPPASWSMIILGSAFSVVFTALLRTWIPGGLIDGHQRVLLMGFDRLTAALASALREAPASVENTPPEAGATNLGELCAARNTRSVVLSSKHPGASFRQLLQLHYSGIEVEGAPLAYERILQRVPWEYVEPSELLFFLNPSTSPAMLAFQAIYKNVLGLTLRVVFAPLLILTSVMIVVFTGGPALEHIECLGFRRIPFQMLRFRIRRSDGSRSWIGDLIERFRLTNLPQLINVVRGEMTLFGPAPVRTAFANRLCQLLPAYPFRFTVKPGIFGWPKAWLDETGSVPDEALLLELDLYYVRQESPSLDLDILLRMMFRRPPARRSAAAISDIARNA